MLNKNSPLSLDPNASPEGQLRKEGADPAAAPLPSPEESPVQRRPGLAEVLPGPCFFRQLRRERLRADRTGAPLSIAVFRFEDDGKAPAQVRTGRFLEFLRANVRETDLLGQLEEGRIAVLLIGTDEEGRKAYIGKLLDGHEDLPSSLVTGTYPDQLFETLAAERQGESPFFPDAPAEGPAAGYPLKRAVDIAGALVGIALFSPLMLLAALAVKLTSPGPVIFRQVRLGKGGQPFVFYKFRSMSCNADDRIHREYVASLIVGNTQAINQGSSEAPLYKLQADPRVTRVGRILRKTSIDELPQFFNVLKGDMSLVGPRPPLPYEAEKYQPWHFRRIFEIKPGITGLWQVEGRSRTSFDDMVRLDLEYIRTCSLGLDLKILLKTVKVVLRGMGAA